MDASVWKTLLVTIGTLIGSYLVYKGGTFTAAKAKEGSDATTSVTAQDSALQAWQNLLAPYQAEVLQLRKELDRERLQRLENQRVDEAARTEAKKVVDRELKALRGRVDKLTDEVRVWKRVAQTIARWATLLRDEVLRLGGTIPATPEELLTLQALEDRERDT
jgi:predicted RNase H-like nuclease (RuvC/YqgF family)